MKIQMNLAELRKIARITGVLYLIIIISGLFSEMFVRSGIIVHNDFQATANNILEKESLFRVGFISDMIMVMSDVGVALLLYILLKPVSKGLSMLAAFFRLAQATVIGLNLLNFFMPLLILGNSEHSQSFSVEQLNSLSSLFLEAHTYGYLISGVFFGFSCIFLGILIFRSIYFPKWLGILVASAGASYLIDSVTNFLAPGFATYSEYLVISIAVVSELSLCLFLLIKGLKTNAELKNV
jgi:hypothetical protein